MAINRVQISSKPIQENYDVTIEMLADQPQLGVDLQTPQAPGKIVGFFNGASGFVELYVVSRDGNRYFKV